MNTLRKKTNIHAPRTTFVGRSKALAELHARLEEKARLIVVMGAPGVGKTRLAKRFARECVGTGAWEGGVWLCDLHGIADPKEMAAEVGHTLGMTLEGSISAPSRLAGVLASRGKTLLVLDDFDLLQPAAGLLGTWLDRAPSLTLLITSRIRLGVPGEVCLELGSMSMQDAVALFTDRVRALRRDAACGDPHIIEEIVERLDRLPLALELAAGHARVLSSDDLLERLDERLTLLDCPPSLTGSAPLSQTIGSSWSHLDKEAREILSLCTVFEGGFTLAAVESVLDDKADTMSVVSRLRDASLVVVRESRGVRGELRFDLYKSIRAFILGHALQALDGRLCFKHATFYARLADRWHLERDGPRALDCIQWFVCERENLMAAAKRMSQSTPTLSARLLISFEVLAERQVPLPGYEALLGSVLEALAHNPRQDLKAGLLLARARCRQRRGALSEAIEDTRAASRLSDESCPKRPEIDVVLGKLVHLKGDPVGAETHLQRVLDQRRGRSARRWQGEAHCVMAATRLCLGDIDEGARHAEAALACFERRGHEEGEASALCYLSAACALSGRLIEECEHLHRALRCFERVEHLPGIAVCQLFLGLAALRVGDHNEARHFLEDALDRHRQLGDPNGTGTALRSLAAVHHEQRDLDKAADCLRGALKHHTDTDHRGLALDHLVGGLIAFDQGKLHHASDCLNQALTMSSEIGDVRTCFESRLFLAVVADNLGDIERASELMRLTQRDAEHRTDRETSTIAIMLQDHLMGRLEGEPRGYSSYLTRAAHRLLTTNLETDEKLAEVIERTLEVEFKGCWFKKPGHERVELGKRDTLRRVLVRLVEERLDNPGAGLALDRIFEAGWPRQNILPEAARNRVYVAIRMLRQRGLEGVLLTNEEGYLIDPLLRVRWSV